MIHLLLDLIRPTSGRALIHDIEVSSEPLAAKRHVAYLSESVVLFQHLTARQNLDYFARLAGRAGLAKTEAHEAMERVALPARAFEQRVRELSKGMRQKLGLAIAMIKDAPALLLDEPISGLDPQAAAELVGTLSGLRDRGKAILMSTHDIFRARQLADRVGILRQGRKVAELDRTRLAAEDLESLYLAYMGSDDPGAG